jgi:pimeloyl-ACP methyl ester carboxylesterase
MPVLAAYGRHDPYYPIELAEFIAQTAPRGSYVVFEESAHAPHYEEPDRFYEVIRDFTVRR